MISGSNPSTKGKKKKAPDATTSASKIKMNKCVLVDLNVLYFSSCGCGLFRLFKGQVVQTINLFPY